MSEGQNSGGEEVKKKRWSKMSERRNRGGEKVEKWWNGKAGQVRERKRRKRGQLRKCGNVGGTK